MMKTAGKKRVKRCGAETRGGVRCRNAAVGGGNRCRMHGGRREESGAGRGRSAEAGEGAGRETVVVIRQMKEGESKFVLLEETLKEAGFWERVEAVRECCGVPKEGYRIVIKPDLELYDAGAPTGTDPELVEHLIELLYGEGYGRVVAGDGLGSSDLWLENRDVGVLADLAGYRYVTSGGRPYDIVNLSEDVVEGGFPEGWVLSGSGLGREWAEAHCRISMAKNKTDEEEFYALGLRNLLGVLPLRDKEYHYRHRLDAGEVCGELLRHTPVHFSVIDAVVSNHGSEGGARVNPLNTNTMIASEDAVLADWAGALKMGIDPYASELNARVLRGAGLPRRYRIRGDLSPYRGWRNVPLVVSDSVRRRNRSVTVRQMVRPWFRSVNRELFPFRSSVDDRINSMVEEFLSGGDRHPGVQAAGVAVNYVLGALQGLAEGYAVMYDKDRVRRQVRTLGLDLEQYGLSDYESAVDYMESLAQIAAQTPPDRNGLRWRYIDRSVLFEYRRRLPVGYEEFVRRVQISAAVRMMNDNIGGACVPVSWDVQGRVTHQAERNIYMPQPNWMVMFGGKVIDVGKLEYIRYGEDRQEIFWRTVVSANDSAAYDDGIVRFGRDEGGGTEITIVARQQFSLPLFWQVINMDYVPAVKDALVSDAYTTFFSRTMANFEAACEGRSVEAGRSWEGRFGEQGAGRMPLEEISETLVRLLGFIEPLLSRFTGRNGSPSSANSASPFAGRKENGDKDAAVVEEGTHSFSTFYKDLFDAVRKDLERMTQMSGEEMP